MFLVTPLQVLFLRGWPLRAVRAVARAAPRTLTGARERVFLRRVQPPPPGGVRTLPGGAEEAHWAPEEKKLSPGERKLLPPRDPEEGRACGGGIRRLSRGEGCLPIQATELGPPPGLSEGSEERPTRGNPAPPMRDRPAKP